MESALRALNDGSFVEQAELDFDRLTAILRRHQ